jgi:hypothetical protein
MGGTGRGASSFGNAFMRLLCVILGAIGLGALSGVADEKGYNERFHTAVALDKTGFFWDSSLVDTNNQGPVITNLPVLFKMFHESGELAGVKLGMSMTEVVALWGKPRRLYRYCFIGPRFWYGRGGFGGLGDLSLCFRGDRLVVIGICPPTALALKFDNGLTGTMREADYERVLGAPTLRHPDPRGTLFVGEIAYRTNGFRTDISFTGKEGIDFISVRLEREAEREKSGEQDGAANRRQPVGGTSTAVGSDR